MFFKALESLEKLFGTFHPNSHEWRYTLTPESALQKLREYNNHPGVLKASRKQPPPEWLTNSFGFAAAKITPNDILAMADYIAHDSVFGRVAPAYIEKGVAIGRVFEILFERCPDRNTRKLLQILESSGWMVKLASGKVLSGWRGTYIFLKRVPASMQTPQDVVRLLKNTESFQIAKKTSGFADHVFEHYPEYKVLLD